ncbi:FecR family protein [Sphingopyxis sp. P1IMeth2]|uniref:FecR family protein n=1 Tax=Sphingopyxis sp. P1IMeth2 TaxID=1892848 RepID=UPI001646421A|nr:FecR domain-containing protein [Sphingopyxis sp. P1IMeth2]
MSDQGFQDEPDDGDGLMGEATVWFGRMRGPEADLHKPAFEAWLARGALHRAFYNRASEIYAMGKFLKEERDGEDARVRPAHRRRARQTLGVLAALAVIVTGLSTLWVYGPWRRLPETAIAPEGALRLATREGQVLTQVLSDGSKVTLQPESALVVRYTRAQRTLRLERGRSRFEVAHERRPFVVLAARGSITARGTIFEVALHRRENVTVRLLQGKVDVAMPSATKTSTIKRMVAGETVSYGSVVSQQAVPSPAVDDGKRLVAETAELDVREFAAAPLGEILTLANRHGTPIRVMDDELSRLKVSGRFRLDEPDKLAAKLALLFDLVVEHAPDGEILLRRRNK